MIPKTNRFHGHNSLSPVYRRGQTVSVPKLSLKYLVIKSDKNKRLAVVVSRKVDKSAVVRNRIRRRIYAVIKERYPKLKQNTDMIISVYNNDLATMKSSELNDLIDQLLKKAELL